MIFAFFIATLRLFVQIGVYRYERRKQHEENRARKGSTEPSSIGGGTQDIHSPAASGASSGLVELLTSADGRLGMSWLVGVSAFLTARADSLTGCPVRKMSYLRGRNVGTARAIDE
jgi:hypothetical protein